MRTWSAAIGILMMAATARAGDDPPGLARLDARPPGEDEALYRCGKVKGPVAVTFKPGVELGELVAWAMSFTCKNFIYSSRVSTGRSVPVSILAPSPMSAEQAWRLFVVALHSAGVTVVDRGPALEIVETAQARRHALPIARGGAATGEEIVRLLLRPAHLPVDELAVALAPFASMDGELLPLPRAGLLVVTDTGGHAARIREMAEEIDRAGPGLAVYTLPVRHARAAELATILRELAAVESPAAAPRPVRADSGGGKAAAVGAPATGEALRVAVDERTNTLVLHATRPAYERTRALVERLDLDTASGGTARAHLVPLRHGDATTMAATLNGTLAGAANEAAGPARPAGKGDPAGAALGQVRVTPDAASNSLLVWATPRDFVAVEAIIRELDAPRAQVFIEAMIVEISAGRSRELGVSWHGGKPTGSGDLFFGGLAAGGLSSATFAEAAKQGSLAWTGLLGGAMGVPLPASLLGTTIPSFGVLFQALARTDAVDILSSPTLMTTDNVKATLSVGQNVAYKAGVSGVAATPGVALENVQREKVGLKLDVTPHVGAGGQVRLEVALAVQDLVGEGELGPTWSERNVSNTVVVGDGDTAVIGGLVGRKESRVSTGVPLLGDLPLLGHLFKSSRREEQKTSLVVLLTPHVLTDATDRARAVDRLLERRAEVLGALDRLDAAALRPRRDARRTRGLLTEIDRAVREVERQRAALGGLDGGEPVEAGPLERE